VFFFSGFSFRQIGSPRYSTETGSLYYGLLFHLQLLPTLPHGNAVISVTKVMAAFDKDFHLAICVRASAHCRRVRDLDIGVILPQADACGYMLSSRSRLVLSK
jgi:hypothetical protein